MRYISTRGGVDPVTSAEAIYRGLAPDGGLFVPESFPAFPAASWPLLPTMSYTSLAEEILGLYLTDYRAAEIASAVAAAYGSTFDHEEKTPLVALSADRYMLELWHGPTAAFKDMALQLLPHLLTEAMAKQGIEQEMVILVATSGDTGKAALAGFAGVPSTRIIVFYPAGGVSEVQRLQMVTTAGDNTAVIAVQGNFDDCQRGVKMIFGDSEYRQNLAQQGFLLSSANSINWGRLLPQIVYYFKAYGQLLRGGALKAGAEMDVVVPTGNFGNILACYYAMRMGLPVGNLICASNKNKILTDVIQTGSYDRRRPFYRTMSPSMDILISSNFERFLFEMTGRDAAMLRSHIASLDQEGYYRLDRQTLRNVQDTLHGDYCDEEATRAAIRRTFAEEGYLIDPHTAVAIDVLDRYRLATGIQRPAVIASTANPYKFNVAVYEALREGDALSTLDEFAVSQALSAYTGTVPHRAVCDLEQQPVRHRTVINKEDMAGTVTEILNKIHD